MELVLEILLMLKRLKIVGLLCLMGLFGGASAVTPDPMRPTLVEFHCGVSEDQLQHGNNNGTWSNGDCVGNPSDC